jgi:hypothetical protein
MLSAAKSIIKILVSGPKKCRIGVIFDDQEEYRNFRDIFKILISTIPPWLLPECTRSTRDRVVYGDVTIDYILRTSALIGKRFDLVIVDEIGYNV